MSAQTTFRGNRDVLRRKVLELDNTLIGLRGVTKAFPGVLALNNVTLAIHTGEVHGLVGENGAGKTTLLRILCGIYSPNKGDVFLKGKKIHLGSSVQASLQGISAVHQELSLCPSLSVAENIFFNRQPVKGALGFVDKKKLVKETRRLLERLRLEISPIDLVQELSLAEKQQVEILKALATKPQLLLLDEPTSALSVRETNVLFDLINGLKEQGVTVMYVSHKIHEVMDICDRISVLRDGEHVKTLTKDEVDEQTLVQLMTGRQASELYPSLAQPVSNQPRFEVQGLSANVGGLRLENINLKVYPGEIVGVAGLVGSGRTEMAEALFGIFAPKTGTLAIDGEKVRITSPWEAIRYGVTYIPEDRKRHGLFLRMKVPENVVVNKLPAVSARGFIDERQVRAETGKYIAAFNIKVSKWDQIVGYLSGGNQQKILLARFLATAPKVLLVDEPTRGIDVGAKREIHFLLRELANRGTAIVMISSELEEILGLSNRIYVMYGGKVVSELPNEEATEEKIMQAIVTAAKKGETKGATV